MPGPTTATTATTASPVTIGVLALQGDVREHVRTLASLGVRAVAVRRPAELAAVDALVLPGGESTTMARLARTFDLLDPLRRHVAAGRPVLGTCAGMILLADRILDGAPGQETVGGLDVTVRRNAFGRQVDSFEGPVQVTGLDAPVHGVFIRAPWVEATGPDVEVLARVEVTSPETGEPLDRIVMVRQGALMATSFHPEVGNDPRVHGLFVDLVEQT